MGNQTPPEIIIVSHHNLDRVKDIISSDPSQLNVLYEPWAETPLGAASHVGNRPIAEYLLSQGAPLVVTTAAMLGLRDEVAKFLASDPQLADSVGAHGISLLYHAALSGDIGIPDIILNAGGGTDSAGHALHAAVSRGNREMVEWLLSTNPDPNIKNFQEKTPLSVAIEQGREDIASILRENGAV